MLGFSNHEQLDFDICLSFYFGFAVFERFVFGVLDFLIFKILWTIFNSFENRIHALILTDQMNALIPAYFCLISL